VKKKSGQKGNLQVKHKRSGQGGEGQLRSFWEILSNRPGQNVVKLTAEHPGRNDGHYNGHKRVEEALSQVFEMFKEGHLVR